MTESVTLMGMSDVDWNVLLLLERILNLFLLIYINIYTYVCMCIYMCVFFHISGFCGAKTV